MRSLLLCVLLAASAAALAGARAAPAARNTLTRTFIKAPNAVCLDGSPAAYYWRRGLLRDKYLIGFLGGGWSVTPAEALQRSQTVYGSSTFFPASIDGMGVTNASDPLNAFRNWSIVFMWYCDGTSLAGELTAPLVVNGTTLHVRGRSIVAGLIGQLSSTTSIASASQIVVYGESAGGVNCLLHVGTCVACGPLSDVAQWF